MLVNGVDLAVETFGDRADPAILLIAGAASSMDWWDVEFCERLAAGARFVIRYDQRDTGQSTTDDAGAPSYRAADLVDDAVGLLDGFGIGAAHLVGISMGGAVAQVAALRYPARVASLTLVATSPVATEVELPGMTAALSGFFASSAPPDFADRDAVVEHIVARNRAFSGDFFDEGRVRETTGRVVERSRNIEASLTNHMRLPSEDPSPAALSTLDTPTLVIHGRADPLFPVEHGQALAAAIPRARLLTVPGLGHETPPPPTWNVIVAAILEHTSGGWARQADRLAARSIAAHDPTAWFERLYSAGAAGEVAMPWDTDGPRPSLVEWADGRRGAGRRAVVVGCGLGQNSEYISSLGFDTVAFDVSPTAVRVVRERYPKSTVEYLAADLLDPPAEWVHAFGLVVEVFTVQALPESVRPTAIANVARFTAPGGTLVVIAAGRDASDPAPPGPPWPLTRDEIDAFAGDGLGVVRLEQLPDAGNWYWWRAEFHRPG